MDATKSEAEIVIELMNGTKIYAAPILVPKNVRGHWLAIWLPCPECPHEAHKGACQHSEAPGFVCGCAEKLVAVPTWELLEDWTPAQMRERYGRESRSSGRVQDWYEKKANAVAHPVPNQSPSLQMVDFNDGEQPVWKTRYKPVKTLSADNPEDVEEFKRIMAAEAEYQRQHPWPEKREIV